MASIGFLCKENLYIYFNTDEVPRTIQVNRNNFTIEYEMVSSGNFASTVKYWKILWYDIPVLLTGVSSMYVIISGCAAFFVHFYLNNRIWYSLAKVVEPSMETERAVT